MNIRIHSLLVFAMVLIACPAWAAPESLPVPKTFNLGAIDAYLSSQVAPTQRVGLSVAIVKDGRLVLAKGYGRSSLKDARPVDTNTLFAIGSVTKQFTCACILLLAEDGLLTVRDPVAKYFPQLTRAKDITLLDLMNHVSGYPDYYPLDFVDRRMQQPIDPDELLRRYAGGNLDFEPGSEWSYSNTGYILLGRIVEKISGESFGAFLTKRILQPLGMDRTVYEPAASDRRLAQGYTTFALSEPEPVALEAKGWIGAAGGLYSTPTDLAKWDLALAGGKVLKPESYALMTTPRELSGGNQAAYGCGLSIKTQAGWKVLAHNGAVSGFNASNLLIPATRSAVIVMCNLDEGLGTLPSQVFSLLLSERAHIPTVAGPRAPDAARNLFSQLQKAKVNRSQLSDEFNYYLTDEKIANAARRLKRHGAPQRVELIDTHERGGMEVTVNRLEFKKGALRALMYRMPDGLIEQFFLYPN
jgi:CubicO group peptidase (beta-lactamase class C family)